MRGVLFDGGLSRRVPAASDGAHLGVAGKDGHVKIGAVREAGTWSHPHRRHPMKVQ